jgi:hypothetical protein
MARAVYPVLRFRADSRCAISASGKSDLRPASRGAGGAKPRFLFRDDDLVRDGDSGVSLVIAQSVNSTASHASRRHVEPGGPAWTSQMPSTRLAALPTGPRTDTRTGNRCIARWLSTSFRQIRLSPEGVGTVSVGTCCSLNKSQHECETQIDPIDRLCQLVFVQQMENGPKHVQRNKDQ